MRIDSGDEDARPTVTVPPPTRRPMRDDEYAVVRSRARYYDTPELLRNRWRRPYAALAICVGFSLWLIPILVINKVLPPRDLVMPFGCGSLIALLAVSFWFFRWRARRKDVADEASQREWYAADLEAREVDEWRLRVVDAVKAEGDDDEGDSFYLELEDGHVLFISEGDLLNPEYDEAWQLQFPTREVSLTRLPHTGEFLGIVGLGEKVPVSDSWPDFTYEDRGSFLPGPLSSYRIDHVDAYDEDDDEPPENRRVEKIE
jgi:hypothetical protein